MPQSSSVTRSPSSVESGASVSRWMTGGAPPSAVAKSFGSTVISPSWRFQYVHIGRLRTTSPVGVRTSIAMGRPSMAQNCLAHGPGARISCSPTSIRPCDVSTPRLAVNEARALADPLLPLEGLGEVGLLHRGAEGHVADGVVRVGLRIRLPDLDAGLHQLAHRRLEIVVPDDAAGDAGGARAGLRLLDDDDVLAAAEAALAQLLRQVVGGREPVDAGADDDVRGRGGRGHFFLLGNSISKAAILTIPWPEPGSRRRGTWPPSSAPSPSSTPSWRRTTAWGPSRRPGEPGSARARRRACSRPSPPGVSSSTSRRAAATASASASCSSATPSSHGSTSGSWRGRGSRRSSP